MNESTLNPFSTLGLPKSNAAPSTPRTTESLIEFENVDASALVREDGSQLKIIGDSLNSISPAPSETSASDELSRQNARDASALSSIDGSQVEIVGDNLSDSILWASWGDPACADIEPLDLSDASAPTGIDEPQQEMVGNQRTESTPPASPKASASDKQEPPKILCSTDNTGSELPRIPGYEILSVLGRGGMGVVYRARHTSLKRLVALKMIRDAGLAGAEHLSRFQVEAEAIASLHHPNIVQIYEIGNTSGHPYFSLELVEGGTLAQKLSNQLLSFREVGELTVMLARAVHSAHERGVIHRDLKPSNILLTREGSPKIADFGLAKQIGCARIPMTRGHRPLGTPSYLAPEQALGCTDVGPASDVYSLGSMLYEMLTGRPPFRGASVRETLNMVVNDEPVAPARLRPMVPRDLQTICLKCLNKDPKKRYPSASALADDLQRWLDGDPILARPMGRTERVWRWCYRYPVLASLLLAITFGTAVDLAYTNRQSNRLTRATALEGAAQQAAMLEAATDYYSSQVVDRLKRHNVLITNDYARQLNQPAIPNPATLTIEMGDRISARNINGMEVRLYSDHPFPSRPNGGVRDDFERMALDRLRENATEPVYSFEEYHGMPVLRYATAQVMQQTCVDCHNTYRDSPKNDWQVGDVRGVVEIIRPLNRDEERAAQGRWEGLLLTGGVAVSTLILTALLLMLDKRRRVRTAL